MNENIIINEYFKSPIWLIGKPEWVDETNKVCDSYIKKTYEKDKQEIKKREKGDYGWSYHSDTLVYEPKLKKLHEWVNQQSFKFLDWQGFNLKDYTISYTESWVQEFSKKGGGHHNSHIHSNNHISVFYYLKCTEKTSLPVFHDPRPGAMMLRLPEKNENNLTYASGSIHYKPKPGTMIFIPAYIPHEYGIDHGIDDFRFIHFNLQAVKNKN